MRGASCPAPGPLRDGAAQLLAQRPRAPSPVSEHCGGSSWCLPLARGAGPCPEGDLEMGPHRNQTPPGVPQLCKGRPEGGGQKAPSDTRWGHNSDSLLPWIGDQAEGEPGHLCERPRCGQWRASSALKGILGGCPPGSKRSRWQLGRWWWAEAAQGPTPSGPPVPTLCPTWGVKSPVAAGDDGRVHAGAHRSLFL